MKIDERYDFDVFEPIEEGWYVLKIKQIDARLDQNGGLKVKATCEIQGTEFDGRNVFENFSTRKQDGTDNPIGINCFNAFLVKSGIAKPGQFTDSTQWENEKFIERLKKIAVDRLYGAYLTNQTTNQGKVMSRTVRYRTVDEVRNEMTKPDKPAETKSENEDDDWF